MESVVMHGVKKLKEELTPWQIEKKIEKQLEDIVNYRPLNELCSFEVVAS